MKYDKDKNHYVLKSGKQIYSHLGIFGIGPELSLSHGYDGNVNDDNFTLEERKEIADYMILLINKWAQK